MNISAFQACANCGACSSLCPHDAITVSQDGLFYRPVVNEEKCTHCGLCSSLCPLNTDTEAFRPIYACFGWHNSAEVVLSSSSGGVFHGLAENAVAQGGVAFGAAYTQDLQAVCFSSTDEEDLSQIKKSKYVESLTGDSFQQVKAALAAGRKVLFCGTPCQVAGLYAYLGSRPEALVTCDFACGGLPSHKIYQDYIRDLEHKYGAPVASIDFRPKTHGWRRYAVKATFQNGRVYNRLGAEDPYLRSFLYGKYTVRDNCLECKFSDHHASDITIADFWLSKELSGRENSDGTSLILCNTPAGQQAMEGLREQYILQALSLSDASYNHKKTEAMPEDKVRHAAFLKLFQERGLDAACSKYLPVSLKNRWKNRLRRMLHKSRRRNK